MVLLYLCYQPPDFGIQREHWTVRTLSRVCQEQLGTKSASKSQVGRFYRRLGLYRPIRRKLLSPDLHWGEKMKQIGRAMAHLGPHDRLLSGDEFKYSSSKLRTRLEPKHCPEGLQYGIPVRRYSGRYDVLSKLEISGLYEPHSGELELVELDSFNYQGYLPGLAELCARFMDKGRKGSKLYLLLDNGPIHRMKCLQEDLRRTLGDQRVQVLGLPSHSANNNPIERCWETLLAATTRHCDTETELRVQLQDALHEHRRLNQLGRVGGELSLCCLVCGHKFRFPKQGQAGAEILESVESHLCFNIPYLSPFSFYCLKHSMEELPLPDGQLSYAAARATTSTTAAASNAAPACAPA